MESFMEQVVNKLASIESRSYTASNGIVIFLNANDEVWYHAVDGKPFNITKLQVAREELLFG